MQLIARSKDLAPYLKRIKCLLQTMNPKFETGSKKGLGDFYIYLYKTAYPHNNQKYKYMTYAILIKNQVLGIASLRRNDFNYLVHA